ncbi:MAG: hypothetical protein ACJ768_24025 [Gaiellaceae bacterium]
MLLALLAPLLSVLTLLQAGSAGGASHTYSDPTGDAGGAPDITSVAVAPDSAGVTFTVHTADASTWDGAAAILDIHTHAGELSYVLHSLHDDFTLDGPSGHVAHPAATATLRAADLTIDIPFSELGQARTLSFRISTPGPTGEDHAPDTSAPAWVVSFADFTPAEPVHGGLFSFRTRKAVCSATLNGVALRGTCRWRVPPTAAGKSLVVVVTVDGAKRRYSFRVR